MSKNDPEFALYSTTADAYRAGHIEGARRMQEKCAAAAEPSDDEFDDDNAFMALMRVKRSIRALKPEDL